MAGVGALKEDFLHCSICTNRLKVPKVLPCIHSFCQGCLENYVKKLKSKQLPCPICRKECDLSETGVQGLQTNFYIVNLGERMDLLERLDESVSHSYTCESCESQEVTGYCLECESKICLKCQKDHQRFPVLRSHSIIPINEIKQPKYQKALKNAKTPICEVHPTESLRFYCKTCSKLICRDCTIVQHSKPDHTFVEASCQVEDIKRELRNLLSKSSSDLTSSLKFIEKGKAGSEAVELQSESVIKKINTSCDEIVALIEKQLRSQAEKMCKEVEGSKMSQTKMIDEKVNMASTWVTRMENTREVTEKVLDENNVWEILAMSHDLISAFHALNIDASNFKWYESDLEQSMAFSSFQPPSVTLGKCSKSYDVILSDFQGNFIAVTYDYISSNLQVLKIRQDKAYNVDDADNIASFKVNITVPTNSKVTAAIAKNQNRIFIGLGRFIVQVSFNSRQISVMEASKDKDTFISFLIVSDYYQVLYLQLSNDNHVKQYDYAQFDWQDGYRPNQGSQDITSSVKSAQFIIPNDHLPIQNVICHRNTLIYSLKEGSYPNIIAYMLSQNESTPLILNSMDTVRGRQLLSIFEGVFEGSSKIMSRQGRYIKWDAFTCYMLWGKASSSSSTSASTFIITEYKSSSRNLIRTWNVPGEIAQPAACYKNTHSNQLIVSDQYGKVTCL